MRTTLQFLLFILISSCNNTKDDPMKSLQLGSEEKKWKSKIEELLKDNNFEEDEYGNFDSYLITNSGKIRAKYKINKPFSISGIQKYSNNLLYEVGELKSIMIDISGDTICYLNENDNSVVKKISKYNGRQSRKVINEIREYLFDFYGLPTINSHEQQKTIDTLDLNEKINIIRENILLFGDFLEYDVWEFKNYKAYFLRDMCYFDSCFMENVYSKALIVFQVNDYDNKISAIREEIKSQLKPNDFIKVEFGNPEVRQTRNEITEKRYEIVQPVAHISRLAEEEDRTISDIRFDIVYLNRFSEEVLRVPNREYEFISGLKRDESMIVRNKTYLILYSSASEDFRAYETIRLNIDDYKWNGKGRIISDIKKIVFSDGSILE